MILLLDTSTAVCRITIVYDDGRERGAEWKADRQLARGLLAFLRDEIGRDDCTFQDLTGIGIMKGPGSFTGLRIGAAVANALASDLHIPIVGEAGSNWKEKSLRRLMSSESDKLILPDYGQAPKITKPKK